MTSKLKVNILADGGDNAIMTSDGSGSLTINNAALKATPAFEAQGSGSNQTIADNTNSKVTVYNTELYDSNNDYTDNRFTPTVAGKYYIYATAYWSTSTANDYHDGQIAIYKNGSNYADVNNNWNASGGNARAEYVGAVVDMNGSSDYVEIYIYQNTNSGGSISVSAGSTNSRFGGYKVIGA